MAKKIIRGLQDLKTASGSIDGIDDLSVPFKAYQKLSVLEMEKYRRGRERQSALAKLRVIDERFEDIDTEKREILASMEAHCGQTGRRHEPEQHPARDRAAAGSFRIKY